jgi:hypothetical protein
VVIDNGTIKKFDLISGNPIGSINSSIENPQTGENSTTNSTDIINLKSPNTDIIITGDKEGNIMVYNLTS